jgi:signal transduction histidine kinase/ActR/RegA family two-component response regulator
VPDRILLLAPRGRDATVAAELLERNGLRPHVCPSLAVLTSELAHGAGAVLITEEALASADTTPLAQWIARQPKWSDLPFIVLANSLPSPRSAIALKKLDDLGNTVLLERPLHAEAMIGALRSALKARRRQYEVRDAAEALERAVAQRTADLEAARRDLELALDAAAMGQWSVDLATRKVQRTLRHDQIFGYAELQDEWTVDRFLAHVAPEERPQVLSALADVLRTGVAELEFKIVAADGSQRWAALRGRTQSGEPGVPTRITGVISDISARKEADAQLAQAQKMDAIGQLTGGVAHDFNNLLTPIVGTLDLLRRRHADDDKTQKLLSGALQAAERASTLTQRLLSFARRQALQPRAVDVGALIDGLVDLIRRSLGPRIDIVLDVPPHLPPARVDPNQLELALLNLAINARDAMPEGGQLTIRAASTTIDELNALGLPPGRYLELVTADTGTGMDSATLARAVEPFFSTKGVGKGTGLGLSMVHGLAAQSGGTLTIDSTPGEGTSIKLWLPATDDPVSAEAADVAEPAAAQGGARIALVDDEAIVRSATADMLRDLGYDVIEFASAGEALSAIRAGVAVDALVTDYLMPAMTGAQLIAELRGAGVSLPALLVTGYAAAGEDVPADIARLAKPFRQTDLAKRIDDLLATRAIADQPQRAAPVGAR